MIHMYKLGNQLIVAKSKGIDYQNHPDVLEIISHSVSWKARMQIVAWWINKENHNG